MNETKDQLSMARQVKITAFFKPVNAVDTVKTDYVVFSDEEIDEEIGDDEVQIIEMKNFSKSRPFEYLSKRKYQETDFIEEWKDKKVVKNESINKAKDTPRPSSGGRQRKCPFYKKMPDTSFAVDAFCYGSIPGIKYYFLTHFHADHYQGLKCSFSHPIYCSQITGKLIELNYKSLKSSLIRTLPFNEATVIDGVEVTFIEANHCPGSVLILFVFPNGKRYLHTGDFRASPNMELHPDLMVKQVDHLYLDTTYCNPKYDFPPMQETLDKIALICQDAINKNSKTLFICGSYCIGKENVFLAIAEALKLKVFTPDKKRNMHYKCYQDARIDDCLISDGNLAQCHVLAMNKMNFKDLTFYLKEYEGIYDEVIAFIPTGWSNRRQGLADLKPRCNHCVSIYGIPYSEHSSYSEMKRFVQFLRPKKVIPTVNAGNPSTRAKMKSIINEWLTI